LFELIKVGETNTRPPLEGFAIDLRHQKIPSPPTQLDAKAASG
jgi:hypothetical protein